MKNTAKTCLWLDSNIWGGLHIINDKIYACCPRSVPLLVDDDLDLKKISGDDIQTARKQLQQGINDGSRKECDGCKYLIEKNLSDIDIGPITSLVLHPHTTCNLRCCYCVLSEEKLGAKLTDENARILPIIKNLKESGFLKENYELSLGGGEPMLIKDLKDIMAFIKTGHFTLISNSSVSAKCDDVIEALNAYPEISKTLITSVDAGTRETFKKIRQRDLYYETYANILKYIQHKVFSQIILKYIFLDSYANSSDEDIFGFCRAVNMIAAKNSAETYVIIDADIRNAKDNPDKYYKDEINDEAENYEYKPADEKIITAAGKMYYALHYLCGVEVKFIGGRFNPDSSDVGAQDIERIKAFAADYQHTPKTAEETYLLALLTNKENKRNTWTAHFEYIEPFRARIRSLYDMIELKNVSSILDLGAGKNFAFQEIPDDLKEKIRYFPIDFLPVTETTIIKDFNKGEFPDQFADLVLCSGIFEYIQDCDGFIKNICSHCDYCLGSYHFAEDTKDERPDIWVNRLTKKEFVNMFKKYGFEAEIIEREFPKQLFKPSLFLFRRSGKVKSIKKKYFIKRISDKNKTQIKLFSGRISFKIKTRKK